MVENKIMRLLFKVFRVATLLQRIYSLIMIGYCFETYFIMKGIYLFAFIKRIFGDLKHIKYIISYPSSLFEPHNNKFLETLMIYYSTQQRLPHYLITIYAVDFINQICRVSKRISYYSQSKSNIIIYIIFLEMINTLIIFIENEYIIGYFTSHNQFEQLPHLINLFSTYCILKYSDDIESNIKIENYVGCHLLRLFCMWYFYQYKLDLILAYIYVKIFDYFFIYITTRKRVISEIKTGKELLEYILEDYKQIMSQQQNGQFQLSCMNIEYEYLPQQELLHNNKIDDDNIVQFLSMLGYCQQNMNHFLIKIGKTYKLSLSLPQKNHFKLPFNYRCSKSKIFSYMCENEYLLQRQDTVYKIAPKENEIIQQIRLINFPQKLEYPIQEYRIFQSKYFLKILVFLREIQPLMVFCSQQILYDLYNDDS